MSSQSRLRFTVSHGIINEIFYVDLPTNKLPVGGEVAFTFFWPDAGKSEATNWEFAVVPKTEKT